MSFFNSANQIFYTNKDREILSRMEDFRLNSLSINQQYQAEADVDTRFYAGDQTIWNDIYGNGMAFGRRQYNFNHIRRIVEMPCGYQRKNRKSTIVVPVENADQMTADQFTKVLMWCNRQDSIPETISEAFTGAMITGMNLLQVWMDYQHDPVSGNIRVSNCSYNTFLIDPFFKRQDLSDCNAIWKRSFITRQEAISLIPDKADQIKDMPINGGRDGKFNYMPESFDYGQKNLLTYDEFFYRDYRMQKMIVDTTTGETMEWTGTDTGLADYLRAYPQVTMIEQSIPTVNLAIVVEGQVMYDGPNPLGIDCYPFVPVLGYYTPEITDFRWRVQGMVRGLRDAQFLMNRRRIIELDILESQVNSGYMAKENSVVDPKSLYKTGQGQVIWVKEEAQMGDLIPIQASQIPPSMLEISRQMSEEIMQISGVNEELLGAATDDKAGILSMLRQGAGLVTLQRLFDQLDLSQKLLGKIMIKVIQNNFVPGKVGRIVEGQPSDRFYSKNFGSYDAAIEEGFDTATQKQMQFAQLLHLREIGVDIPADVLIDAATLQNKEKLIQAIKQKEQQGQQMQQQQAQMAQQQEQATMQMAQARAAADMGLAHERMSRISENEQMAVERRSQAIQNVAEANNKEEEALLNKVKMLKELGDIDLRQLKELMSLQQSIKQEYEQDMARKQAEQEAMMERQTQQQQQQMAMKQQQEQAMMAQMQQQQQQPPMDQMAMQQPPQNGMM